MGKAPSGLSKKGGTFQNGPDNSPGGDVVGAFRTERHGGTFQRRLGG